MKADAIDTWDVRWTFSVCFHAGLTVLPDRNVVSNIGPGGDARHTHGVTCDAKLPRTPMTFPLRHPADVARHVVANRLNQTRAFGTSMWTQL